MNISSRKLGDVTILTLDGGLGYDNYKRFKDSIEPFVSQDGLQLVIDLGSITYLSSWGIGSLLSISSKVTKRGGAVAFAGLHGEISEIIHIMRLNTVFHLFDTIEEAAESLAAGA